MSFLKSFAYGLAGLALAGQASAHGIEATTGTLAPAVKPLPWWHLFLPSAEAAAQISVSQADGYRYIKTDSLPNHQTGQFPGRGNPHSIKSHARSYRVKLQPQKGGRLTPVGHNLFGIALNGVVFDAATAEYWNNNRDWNIEAIGSGVNLGLDSSNAHVQPDGTYHYHGVPEALLVQGAHETQPVLLGYAADGFPIYGPFGYRDAADASSGLVRLKSGWRLKSGKRAGGPGGAHTGKYTADWEYVAGSGDLDQCNGRDGVTPEYPGGTYHYVVTREFPNIGRCWVGFPDASFRKQRGGGQAAGSQRRAGQLPQGQRSDGQRSNGQSPGGGGGPGMQPGGRQRGAGGGPPQAALAACEGAGEGDACTFDGPRGQVDSQCMRVPGGDMACVPPHMLRGGGPDGPGGPGGPGGRRPR